MKTSRATFALAVIAVLGTLTVAPSAAAQGRGMGRHRGERSDSAHTQSKEDPTEEMAKRFEDMAATKPVLKDVKVEKSVKDSIQRIETSYRYAFRSYGRAMQKLIDDAAAQGGAPDGTAVTQLRDDARKLQDREYAELRDLIAADQRAKFDENVAKSRADANR
jgi:molybdenum-dependent DNA-binding transcriptional regulator ModE